MDSNMQASEISYQQTSPGMNGNEMPVDTGIPDDGDFGTFASRLDRELAPRGLLQQVLSRRLTLTAWTLRESSDHEFQLLEQGRSFGTSSLSSVRLHRLMDTLATGLDLLRKLQAEEPWTDEDTAADLNPPPRSDSRSASRFQNHADPFEKNFPEYSNEWPFLPDDAHRGRYLADSADEFDDDDDELDAGDEETDTPAAESDTPLAPRWQDRLVFDFTISERSPVVRGTWITVHYVVSLIVDGWTWADILRSHPELTEEDIRTCLAYTVAEEEGEI